MPEQVAVITDVHGNAPALRAALADIDASPDIAHIYCLGDMIAFGPDTNAVLSLLTSRPDVTLLAGNHEGYALALLEGRRLHFAGEELAHQQWIAAGLDRQFVPVLAGLPRELTVTHGAKSIRLLHYHRGADGGLQPIDWNPSVEHLDAIYDGAPEAAVCFGHHHPVHLFRSERRVYVNPGSLGCCDRPLARYAVLDLHGPQVDVSLRAVPYDNRAFLASYQRLGVPGAAIILRIFHGGQRP